MYMHNFVLVKFYLTLYMYSFIAIHKIFWDGGLTCTFNTESVVKKLLCNLFRGANGLPDSYAHVYDILACHLFT